VKKQVAPYPNKTIAIVQARMGSSRLPGKVMLDIAGRPMLSWVVERTRRANRVDNVVVATTIDPEDDHVSTFCSQQGVPCTRGSVRDVLDRYYQAACEFEATIIVRITADCPLIDPNLIDQTVERLWGCNLAETPFPTQASPEYDFAANRLPPPWRRTYPIGLDVEVCTIAALETAWQEATAPHHREHVMPYLYENPKRFKIALLDHEANYGHMRWTVDTAKDLELVREIFSRFENEAFTWLDVLQLFEDEPQLAQINAFVRHKTLKEVDERTV